METRHAQTASAEWASLHAYLDSRKPVTLDGQTLSVAGVIAVALHSVRPAVTADTRVVDQVQRSVELVDRELNLGRTIYGVNTGFGGSADTRTTSFEALQVALQQHLNVGILLPSDKGIPSPTDHVTAGALRSHAMPAAWVKAMMLIRCNSLLRGHSGVRISVINSILALVERNMTPVVPLRGSISASGDLSPLSYIAGVLEGNPDVYVRIGIGHSSAYTTADNALEQAGLQPTRLQAKETLGIVNGTATSCAAACVAIHQAQQMAVLSQLLTAMGTEALLGTAHNYHPFISATRPHPGQKEAAANILAFLSDSALAPSKDPEKIGLAQDRYALRTAPQWIGPQLEDLMLARQQVETEINSTTDNPLIDVANNAIHHGGNFQAVAITSAMEKTKSAMQMLGKLLYAQCSELINHEMNGGLPPNLSADDPSNSFTFKGFDVNMAAYMSELAYLSNPVSSHVQSTEMNNQSVNSLALIAARYTNEAIEVLSLMAATYLYALCQALDLRCLHLEFVKAAAPIVRDIGLSSLHTLVPERNMESVCAAAWEITLQKWIRLAHCDLAERGPAAAKDAFGPLLEILMENRSEGAPQAPVDPLAVINEYRKKVGLALNEVYDQTRSAFFSRQTTPTYISPASRILYQFVREGLNVPMHRGLADHPTLAPIGPDTSDSRPRKIIGSMASEIYVSVRDGRLHERVMEALRHVGRAGALSREESGGKTDANGYVSSKRLRRLSNSDGNSSFQYIYTYN